MSSHTLGIRLPPIDPPITTVVAVLVERERTSWAEALGYLRRLPEYCTVNLWAPGLSKARLKFLGAKRQKAISSHDSVEGALRTATLCVTFGRGTLPAYAVGILESQGIPVEGKHVRRKNSG